MVTIYCFTNLMVHKSHYQLFLNIHWKTTIVHYLHLTLKYACSVNDCQVASTKRGSNLKGICQPKSSREYLRPRKFSFFSYPSIASNSFSAFLQNSSIFWTILKLKIIFIIIMWKITTFKTRKLNFLSFKTKLYSVILGKVDQQLSSTE